MRTILFVTTVVFLAFLVLGTNGTFTPLRNQLGSIFFVDSTTVKKMRTAFDRARSGGERITVLIVPGHDRADVGAAFGAVTELALNVELGVLLRDRFAKDTRFDVLLAQDGAGFNPVLEKYFLERGADILEFRRQKHLQMYSVQQAGLVSSNVPVEHNNAPGEMVTKLYGMNMWANEQKTDIVVHIHFNDTSRGDVRSVGENSGLALYIPDHQYSNAAPSRAIAESVFERLRLRFPKSNLSVEKEGIIEDQQLIGLGANNSLDAPSIFIEYGYIYEPQFQYASVRTMWLREAALQTYRGIVAFFENQKGNSDETSALPHSWKKDLTAGVKYNPDVFALQMALSLEGLYPPDQSSKNDCPMTGTYFDCTTRSVLAFQKKYHLEPSGDVDRLMRAQLNVLYGE